MTDDRTESRRYYECQDCGQRVVTHEARATCAGCGGTLANIGVTRE